MPKWMQAAADLQYSIRTSETESAENFDFSDKEIRQSIMHTRQDIVLLVCQIASNRDPLFASNSDPSGGAGMGLST